MHCDLRVRWKVASDLRFRAAISEPKTPSCCGISGDLAPSTRKSLAIAIVRFWCAKFHNLTTILTQIMADEFNFLWSQIQNHVAEADADVTPVPGQFELHGRCRCGVLLSPCFGALFVADLIVGWRNSNFIADAEAQRHINLLKKSNSNHCRYDGTITFSGKC